MKSYQVFATFEGLGAPGRQIEAETPADAVRTAHQLYGFGPTPQVDTTTSEMAVFCGNFSTPTPMGESFLAELEEGTA